MIEQLIKLLHLPEEPEECKFKDTCRNYNQTNLECQRYYNDRKEYCFDACQELNQLPCGDKQTTGLSPDTLGLADNFKKNWGRR